MWKLKFDQARIMTNIENVNWPRYWVYLSSLLFFWTLIGVLVPPDHYKVINTVFSAIVGTVGYFTRATKWVKERNTVPGPNDGQI
jgi:hypothetical protein